jgi:hypothetical protein
MVKFCSDVDIARYEPILFGELYLRWQKLASGQDGELSGTGFTSEGADFIGAGVEAGGVIYLQSAEGTVEGLFEIVSVDSQTQLTVSVIRADVNADSVVSEEGSGLLYRISTLKPQIAEAGFRLTESIGIRPGNPTGRFGIEDISDASGLRLLSVFSVISAVYGSLAGERGNEGFWQKSLYYRKEFDKVRQNCRIGFDELGDGSTEVVLEGGTVKFYRE